METSAPEQVIELFNGALSTRILDSTDLAFKFEGIFRLDHPLAQSIFFQSPKPPLHFHPYQKEWVKVLSGRLVLEVDGQTHLLTPDNPEFCVQPWVHHRLYPAQPPTPNDQEEVMISSRETKVLLWGEKTKEPYHLDILFLENWHKYGEEMIMNGKSPDLIQVLSMFDAGGSYLSLPSWVPFGRCVSLIAGIAVGRWLGGFLGYQPFFEKWSTNWNLACKKMETSAFQRRFATRSKID